MAGKGKITRKEIVEDKVLKVGKDFAKSLQPGIDATQKWEAALRELKNIALEYANVEKQFKVAEGRKEFLQIKQQEEALRKRTAEAVKAEQNALIAKQKVVIAEIDTEKKQIALTTQKNRLQQKTIKLTEKEKLELRILNRGKREAAILSSKLSTEYEKQSVKLLRLRRRYKDVALTQGESGKRAVNLRKHILALDAALKKVDANVGQFQRNVGNYTKAMQSARAAAQSLASAMGLVGGAFLVVQVVRDAIKVVRDFEKQNATLSAILQVEREDMQGLTDDAVRLGETTVKTANQVTELQIAYARLGFEQQEIVDLTESTISGSIAMNAELDKTANLVGAVVNTFDELSTTDAPKIIDVLSLATSKSALNFEKLETGIPIVAGAADAAGIPFTRLIALMGKLADSGIDVSTSSTSLRNIFIESAAQGLNYEQILEKIKGSQDKLTAANDEFGKRAAVSSSVLAKNIDTTKELDDALNKAAGTAERMADKELDTLDGSIKLVRSAWEGYILRLNESSEAGNTLKEGLSFLAKNLSTIINTVITATKIWIGYKIAVALARLQTSLMSKQAALSRLAMLKQAQGVTTATLSWKAFNRALRANALFLIVSGIVALISVMSKLNKSLIETVNELHEANEEFVSQTKSTIELNDNLSKMADRHDELTKKSSLSKKEQKGLDDIIKKIAKHVPEAVIEIDKYGGALDINNEKVKEFIKENGKIANLQAQVNINKQKDALNDLKVEIEDVNNLSKSNNSITITGIGTIRKFNGVLKKETKLRTSSGLETKKYTALNQEQRLEYEKYVKGIEEGIKTVQKDIEANEDIIASVTGVKNARQLEAEANQKAVDNAEALAIQKAEEVLVLAKLKSELKALKKTLSDTTKNGYDKLTVAQGKSVVETRKAIVAKQKEIDAILGVTKANKSAEKAAKQREAAEKKLRQDAFNLSAFSLKQRIKDQQDIAKNEEETFKVRKTAIQEQSRLEIELAKLTAKNKFDATKEFSDKEIEALITKGKVSKETLKKVTDEELLIIAQYQAKKNDIQSKSNDSTDTLDLAKIKADADKQKAVKEKALNDELRLENEAFIKRESIYEDEEKAVELRERRIAEIKKKYAIEALNDQVKATETLLESAELSAKKRAEYEEKLSKLKLDISNLTTEHFIENNEKEIVSVEEKVEAIKDLSQQLFDALIELANSIFDSRIQKIDDEITRNDEKYERLLENENLSATEREAIETQQEKKREELEKKKRKEQRKQAILNKAMAALDIGINTGIAIVKAVAASPVTGGLPFSAIAAAVGALQLATVLAKPIPKYAKGTDYHKGGIALVGEERPEVISEPNKTPYIVDKPSIVDLPTGTKVVPSLEDYKKLHRASIIASIDIENKKLNDFHARQAFKDNHDLLNEVKGMREDLRALKQKQPTYINLPKIDIEHEVWRQNNINS